MADDQKMINDLKKCMKDANGDPDAMKICRQNFEAAGGTTEGGKVFTTPNGGKVFVTDGGKVFTLPA